MIDAARLIADYPPQRVRPGAALLAMARLIRDPQDTRQVALLEIALGGCAPRRAFARFVGTAHGRAVLAERRSLVDVLDDHAALRQLPDNTLGRHYLAFMEREGLSAQGLFDATPAFTEFLKDKPEAARLFSDYTQRGSHDLYHVLAGYGRDELGEACVVAFAYEQLGITGYKVIATVGPLVVGTYLRRAGVSARGLYAAVGEAARSGRRARWLPGEDMAALLTDDIETVRARLGIQPPHRYTAIVDRVRTATGWRDGPFADLPKSDRRKAA